MGLPAARLVLTVPAPVPDSATVVGLFVALLVMVSVPVRVPEAVGRKRDVDGAARRRPRSSCRRCWSA